MIRNPVFGYFYVVIELYIQFLCYGMLDDLLEGSKV
jgi:hypothetical protein